jgi:hypothetical protein
MKFRAKADIRALCTGLWKEENGRVSMYCFGGQIYDDDCDDGDRVALAIEVIFHLLSPVLKFRNVC